MPSDGVCNEPYLGGWDTVYVVSAGIWLYFIGQNARFCKVEVILEDWGAAFPSLRASPQGSISRTIPGVPKMSINKH
jgi:hypothetical protein